VRKNWISITEELRCKQEKDMYYLSFAAQTGMINPFLLVWESSINWTIFCESPCA